MKMKIMQTVCIYKFADIQYFIAMITYSTTGPIYLLKVEQKRRATETLSDRYGHTIFPGELFSKENI